MSVKVLWGWQVYQLAMEQGVNLQKMGAETSKPSAKAAGGGRKDGEGGSAHEAGPQLEQLLSGQPPMHTPCRLP